ncbi:MAG: hypothetical protein Q9163_005895 [Psora crenata]
MAKSSFLRLFPTAEGTKQYGAISITEGGDQYDLRARSRGLENQPDSRARDSSRKSTARQRSESTSSARNKLKRRLSASSPTATAGFSHSTSNTGGDLPFGSSDNEEILGGEVIAIGEASDSEEPPDNSAYPQVRASVAATDNLSASIDTPRMWTLSLLCALLGSATNLFFSLRYPSVAVTPVIALVIVHPLGLAWDRLLKAPDDPHDEYENGARLRNQPLSRRQNQSSMRRLRLRLAQGHWNEKEHACVYISSNVSFGFAFATDVIVEQSKFYGQDVSIVYQLLLTISTQILGYSFAGLARRFLVRPPSMIWPATLMSTAMLTAMHKSEDIAANGWRITRWNFFIVVWGAAFAWYFVPGLLVPALSYFSVITWFNPDSVILSNLFGVRSGLGLFPMTFDWAQVAYIGSPLLTPWWAAANVVGGLVLVLWVLAPVLYYRNALFSAYLPILSSNVFDNQGMPYDVSRVLTRSYQFDKDAYASYSKVYLPITYVLSYGVQFASLTALVTHTVCWHGSDIWQQSKKAFRKDSHQNKIKYKPLHSASTKPSKGRGSNTFQERGVGVSMGEEDVHNRLMRRYQDAPASWYLLTFISMLAIGIFLVEYYPVYLPWYGLLLSLSITTIFFIPVGIVMAITNQQSSLYLISQLICGILFPGRPVANMVFVTYCYISSAQGLKFSSDLKLGQYMKIPPKLLFKVQMAATLVSSVTQIGVLNWMLRNIPGICKEEAINGFTCPLARVHFNGSILWGVVGPARFFGEGALYRPLIWAFLVGAIAPLIACFIARRRSATSIWRKVNFPVLFGSLSWIPPATGLNFSVWALVCFFFNSFLRRKAPGWWGKYTMTLSAALDSGLAFGVLVVFFGVLYPGWEWVGRFDWWGTRVFKHGCDWKGCAWKTLGEGERFDA